MAKQIFLLVQAYRKAIWWQLLLTGRVEWEVALGWQALPICSWYHCSQYCQSNRGWKYSLALLSLCPALPHGRKTVLFALLGSHESVLPPCLTGGCLSLSAPVPKGSSPSKNFRWLLSSRFTVTCPLALQNAGSSCCLSPLLSSQDRQVGLSCIPEQNKEPWAERIEHIGICFK